MPHNSALVVFDTHTGKAEVVSLQQYDSLIDEGFIEICHECQSREILLHDLRDPVNCPKCKKEVNR